MARCVVVRRRREPWRRPWLPIAMLLGYAGLYRDLDTRRLRVWVEPDDTDPMPTAIVEAGRRGPLDGRTEIPS